MKQAAYRLSNLRRWGAILLFQCLPTAGAFAQTILFRDDFGPRNNGLGPDWGLQQGWSLPVNTGSALGENGGSNGGQLATARKYSETDFVLESNASNIVADYKRYYALTFGQPSLQPADEDKHYAVQTLNGYRLSLVRFDGDGPPGTYEEDLADTLLANGLRSTSRFRVVRRADGQIRVYLDQGQGFGRTPVLEAYDTTYPTLGHFGWRLNTEGQKLPFFVDYIQATTLPLVGDVSASSGKPYDVVLARVGTQHYLDRAYTFTSLPAPLVGAQLVRTANDDKALITPANTFLRFRVEKPTTVYVAYDARATALPSWLTGFERVPDQVGTTDPGRTFNLYARAYAPFQEVQLGANRAAQAAGTQMMYLAFAVPTAADGLFQAENAVLWGPVVAQANAGYTGAGYADYGTTGTAAAPEYIEWTVQVPTSGLYSVDYRYALQGSARRLTVRTNGGSNSFQDVDFPPTGSWSKWDYLTTQLQLKAGQNTIRLEATAQGGPNVDLLRLSFVPSSSRSGQFASSTPPASSSLTPGDAVPSASWQVAVRNPLEDAASFQYQLPAAAHVRLRVFDWRGQPIGTLVDGLQQAGLQQVKWPTSALPQGVYLYRLEVGREVRSGRLIKN